MASVTSVVIKSVKKAREWGRKKWTKMRGKGKKAQDAFDEDEQGLITERSGLEGEEQVEVGEEEEGEVEPLQL
ncbi:MAG: hypothetical protein M1827_005349 [Pycnora praestabilis]|nr:MAG: hypothetical protein M1827_005349 [Pycnora praestabilis]